jgi:archaellum component FlaC
MEVFSMSFLDCMSCGFGAVILFFMIINSQVRRPTEDVPDLSGETTRLEYEILNQRKNLVLAKNSIEDLEDEQATAEQQIAAIIALIEKLKKELEKFDTESLAKVKRVEKLKSDIESLEKERKRLLALEQAGEKEGAKVRRFTGDGDRQYLTGLKVGGEHILVLVDASASMLDRKIINVLRRRNMSDAIKLRSLKWRQAVATVDWLSAQFPEGSKFQIYTFNTEPKPVLKGSDGIWLEVGEGKQLDEAISLLRRTIPENGTNMLGAYSVIKKMNPLPDNVILLIDGLPTMNAPETKRGMVTGRERFKLFLEAEREIPKGVPVNVLLFPMEGDYEATISFWVHAWSTGGSFMSISKDWP